MTEDLQQLADRANSSPYKTPGLLSCTVHSNNPPVLQFTFTDDQSAHAFAAAHLTLGTGFLYEIHPGRSHIVFENRAPSDWERLVQEQEAARGDFLEAFKVMNQRLIAVAAGDTRNPTLAQMEASDQAWRRWQDVLKRMHECAERQSGG
jgi:hypothetical protein